MAVFALLESLAPHIEEEVNLVINADEEAGTLSSKLRKIQVGLQDAERKSVTDENVKDWLKDLEDLVYEMEDVLDEWEAMNLQLQLEGESEDGSSINAWEKVRSLVLSLCSCFRHVLGRRELALKMKTLSGRLDNILEEKGKYSFVQGESNHNRSEELMSQVESTCLLDNPRVYIGREFDEERIVKLLMPIEVEEHDAETQMISIVGLGGVGKTALAKLAYNHPEVEARFKLRVWVSVSDPFDPTKIAKAILEDIDSDKSVASNTSSTLNALVGHIKQILSNKKFLVVLDDVWTEDRRKWEPLKNCLVDGTSGSRILVTTRNEAVARMMGTSHLQRLGLLSDLDCGKILNEMALRGRTDEEQEKLGEIGLEIAKKCNGLPLAAKTVGSMLALKYTEQEWLDVLESPLWKYEDEVSDLFRLLKLSYLDLDPILKRCFLSCTFLPRVDSIPLYYLINVWMAYGCISSTSSEDEVRLIGLRYFQKLAMRSFLEILDYDEHDGRLIKNFKVHDIMYDFAIYMSRGEPSCSISRLEGPEKVERVLHGRTHYGDFSPNLLEKLRSFSACYVSQEEVPLNLISLLKRVRLLAMCDCDIEELSPDVGKLIHLRYLDLSWNPIKELPLTVTNLYKLQTLDLQGCEELLKLPQGIEKLITLRHLIIKSTPKLREFPEGLRQLKGLCTLSRFLVGEYGSKFEWLENLDQLHGNLRIEISAADVEDAKKANLRNKNHIRGLKLYFKSNVRMEVILEVLQPPCGIEILKIYGFEGKWFPKWIMDFSAPLDKLTELVVHGFDDCPLPPLAKLPCLETLVMRDVKFKYLRREFVLAINEEDNALAVGGFLKLKSLYFYDCGSWEEWEDIEEEPSLIKEELSGSSLIVPCLRELGFFNCPQLKGLPHKLLKRAQSLETLEIWRCKDLKLRYDPSSGTDLDKLSHIPHIQVYSD